MNRLSGRALMCLIALICLFSISVSAYSDRPVNASNETINVIKLLEVANGDQHGNMNFEKNVTRAEFVKMAINASTSKETAANIRLNVSLFPDVKNTYWGAGYISVAINNGLVNGYIDGTFKPNNNVTLEEAATIILRLLGYSNEDLVGSYPAAQLQKYKDLGLNEGIDAEKGDKLTREECMVLIYNALSAKTKQGSVYCTALGLKTNNDGKLDYSALLEEKLDGPIIVHDRVNYIDKNKFSDNESTIFVLNNATAKKEDIRENDVIYYSDIINTVFIYRKTATGIIENSGGTSVTLSGKNYSISTANAKTKLSLGGEFNENKAFVTLILGINDGVVDVEKGDISKISDNDENATLLSMINSTISNAVYISNSTEATNWQSKIPFSTENAEIFLNGKKASSTTVNTHDVIYYSKAFNSIWIYRKTVSGTIEAITPASSPSSVSVSGKIYNVVTSDAAYDLSIYGKYEVGDNVTLILGLGDECVALEDTSVTSGIIYGVVTDTGGKKYTDKNGDEYTADYVTVTDTNSVSHIYEFDNRHYTNGDAVKVAYGDNITISHLPDNIGKGTAAALSSAFKNGRFSPDCEIIDTNGIDVIKIKPSRITGTVIDPEQFIYTSIVLYCEFDENDNICRLILKDFTGDLNEYGVVTESSAGRITYMTDRNEKTITTEGTGCSVGAAKLKTENGLVVSASTLVGEIDNVSSVTSVAVYDTHDNIYPVSSDLKVFIKTASGYEYSSVSQLSSGNYEYKAYYDKHPDYGGRIRVIIAYRKV